MGISEKEKELIGIVREIIAANEIDQDVAEHIINSFVLENKFNELGGMNEFCEWVGGLCVE